MHIFADENIPLAREAFGPLGALTLLPGRAITAAVAREADALIIRSVTRVDAALLEDSRVRFVGTCTAGEDHVDQPYLRRRGIAFASAPGCNATSVAEYLVAALLELEAAGHLRVQGASIGIVGHGQVGRRVAARVRALGMHAMFSDPPLAESTGDPRYRPLDDLLACDVLTLHCPLVDNGPYPTRQLVDDALLQRMKPGAILINTARGEVAEGAAVRAALGSGQLRAAVLDVWEDEPQPDPALVEAVFIGTPHIAGYSFDGKLAGTTAIYAAFCQHVGVPPVWTPDPAALPQPAVPEMAVESAEPGALLRVVRAAYAILEDDQRLRATLPYVPEARAAHFDALRKHYPLRREFAAHAVRLAPEAHGLALSLNALGFHTTHVA